jgi:bacillithiol biosynthesis cysteine-adding enzyme BshC
MQYTTSYQSYSSTGLFSNLVLDYLNDDNKVKSLYAYKPDLKGIEEAIQIKSKSGINRTVLVAELKKQYDLVITSENVTRNIDSLLNENAFTICTAHQPNLFTGHLYFIYKIIHAIKLAAELNQQFVGFSFVPVYYMGSEDADLQELGSIHIDGVDYKWNTHQRGAVGRMTIDDELIFMLSEIENQLSDKEFGKEISSHIKSCYSKGKSIQQATFELVNSLFQDYGLVVLIPDNTDLKSLFKDVMKKELTENFSHFTLQESIKEIEKDYKIQTVGRDINLFYLKDDIRERIEFNENQYQIVNTNIVFTKEEILNELSQYPERFSPNVVLRPLYQELILPNIVFIGGGGELAYWLEFKNIFKLAELSLPVLILRNSFTILKSNIVNEIHKMDFGLSDFYKGTDELFLQLLRKRSKNDLELNETKTKLAQLYSEIKSVVSSIDQTLTIHTEALHTKALKKIISLEKKMIRAEKRKHKELFKEIESIHAHFFNNGVLQERVDSILSMYAKYGDAFIKAVYESSNSLDHQFCNLIIK